MSLSHAKVPTACASYTYKRNCKACAASGEWVAIYIKLRNSQSWSTRLYACNS